MVGWDGAVGQSRRSRQKRYGVKSRVGMMAPIDSLTQMGIPRDLKNDIEWHLCLTLSCTKHTK